MREARPVSAVFPKRLLPVCNDRLSALLGYRIDAGPAVESPPGAFTPSVPDCGGDCRQPVGNFRLPSRGWNRPERGSGSGKGA